MRAYSVDALVLRTYRYGEADRIVVFLTEDRGKKRGVAKNATESRRRFGGGARAADARAGDLRRARASRAGAAGSRSSRSGRRFGRRRAGRRTTPRTCWGTRRILPSCSTSGRRTARRTSGCSGWARRSARRSAAGGRSTRSRGTSSTGCLRLEGVYPALDVCPRCGRPTLDEGAALVAGRARVSCARTARTADRGCRREAMAFLQRAAGRTPADVATAGGADRRLRELEHVHQRLIAMHLEKELRSARVVKELRPSS